MHSARPAKRGTSAASFPRATFVALLVALSTASAAFAQHTMASRVIAGGGAQGLSGNDHTLSGTLGQPATATLAGPTYEVRGGFWHSFARDESIFSNGFEGGPP